MLGLLSQPKPQSSDTAIYTLCDRLSNSLLIEDRKAAVLALRGLAHENRELVASNGLQGLFAALIKDSHDLEAAKAILETLLILFNTDTRRKTRNRKYISPLILSKARSESAEPQNDVASDISLWLTDRLLHDEAALTRVLHLAASKGDPFTAVYALQLVSVMVANRPVETKQTMLSSGGVGSLVLALGSPQDMVRDEALLLLNALTTDHLELQKLVAFEGGFDKAFEILREGGGVVFGGRAAEDCLALVSNLIEYNTSNQKLFTASEYVNQWADVLQSIVDAQNEGTRLREQALTNIEAALLIGQLLCVLGAEQTEHNQNVLHKSNALTLILQIAFGPASPPQVRVAALITVASLINGNNERQDDLLAMDVPYYDLTVRKVVEVEPRTVPVAQALLNWSVSLSASHLFDLRCASLLCLSSMFNANEPAKLAFVQEQVGKYQKSANGTDTTGAATSAPTGATTATNSTTNDSDDISEDINLVEVLAEFSEDTRLNPFRIWFAAAITMRLFINAPEVKDALRNVTIGDESLGMEVHTLIQAIAGELQRAMPLPESAVALGYLQLICVWTYDDIEAVNELTSESSVVQALLAHQTPHPLVESLSAIALGISYAFSTAESPLSRHDFHRLLTTSMGRDQYRLLVRRFKNSSTYQNYDPNDMFEAQRDSTGSPAVYLDAAFVGLMRETLQFVSNAIDASPDIQPSSKVTFEMLDEVKVSLHTKTKEYEVVNTKLTALTEEHKELQKKLEDAHTHGTKHEKSSTELLEKLSKLEKEFAEVKARSTKLSADLESMTNQFKQKEEALKTLEEAKSKQDQELQTVRQAKEKADEGVNNLTRELFSLQRARDAAEKDKTKLQTELNKLKPKLEATIKSESGLKKELQESKSEVKTLSKSLDEKSSVNEKLVAKLKETASILQQREEEEKELNATLSELKLASETRESELVTLRNREATSRKNHDKLAAELTKLKEQESTHSKSAEELSVLKTKTDGLQSRIAEFEAKEKEYKNNIKSLESKVQEFESATKESDKNLASLETSNKKLKDMNTQLVKDVASLRKDAKELKENNNSNSSSASSSEETTKQLKEELDEKQAALDELLLLLDDLTEKKNSYKSRLRDLKEEVSESEDEDDEDDEEDDDDDNNDNDEGANGGKQNGKAKEN